MLGKTTIKKDALTRAVVKDAGDNLRMRLTNYLRYKNHNAGLTETHAKIYANDSFGRYQSLINITSVDVLEMICMDLSNTGFRMVLKLDVGVSKVSNLITYVFIFSRIHKRWNGVVQSFDWKVLDNRIENIDIVDSDTKAIELVDRLIDQI